MNHVHQSAAEPAAQHATQRLAAFTLALLLTFGMFASVDHLATSEPAASQLARAEAAAARS
jgi:hypothetical protein